MIEKLVNSKTRLKILKFFLSHIDDRYYLRELERLLNESLSPLRRQLIKLNSIGILITEEEANLKYYRLNKNFEGLEELKRLVLEGAPAYPEVGQDKPVQLRNLPAYPEGSRGAETYEVSSKRIRFDLVALSFISFFVLITAIFVVYANTKSMKQVAKLISTEQTSEVAMRRLPKSDMGNGEMISKKWKVIPGNIPVLSSGETDEEKSSKEL
jgi:DNA-binding transcriptional ArsR family regulator